MYKYARYFAINVSSPNTPNLRKLLEKAALTDIVQAVNGAMDEEGGRIPLYIKVSPDLTREALYDVIHVALDNGVRGIIASNTTVNAEIKSKYGPRWANQDGGLSGDDPDYRRMTTEDVAFIYNEAGPLLEIAGVGGVKDGPTALEKIKAGATVVQVVTAMRGEGLGVFGKINRELLMLMDQERVHHISELVGVDAKRYR